MGVLAAGFTMPVRDVEFVLPFAADHDPRRGARNSLNFIHGVGRLGEQVTLSQAASELTAIARRLQEQFPVENARKRGVRMVGVIDGIVGPFRTALLTLFAAVGAVLLIACANLANLMLTRATSRRKDLAVQLALGSSRMNVVRQVLVEALLVGVSGGVLGVLVARWGVVGSCGAGADTTAPIRRDPRRCRRADVFAGRVVAHGRALRRHPRACVRERGRAGCAPGQRPGRDRRQPPSLRRQRASFGGSRPRHSRCAGQLGGRARRRAAHRHDDAGEELRERAGGRAGIRFDAGPFGASHPARQTVQQSRRDCHVPASPRPATVVAAERHEYGRDLVASLERIVVARAVHRGG